MAASKRAGWGGPRRGAGRKPAYGEPRRNRVVVFVTDAEWAKLSRLAEKRDLPLGTAAYEMFSRALRRMRT